MYFATLKNLITHFPFQLEILSWSIFLIHWEFLVLIIWTFEITCCFLIWARFIFQCFEIELNYFVHFVIYEGSFPMYYSLFSYFSLSVSELLNSYEINNYRDTWMVKVSPWTLFFILLAHGTIRDIFNHPTCAVSSFESERKSGSILLECWKLLKTLVCVCVCLNVYKASFGEILFFGEFLIQVVVQCYFQWRQIMGSTPLPVTF